MAQSNKYIITYVDEITKFYFFSRFDFIFRKKGFRLCIMTNRISIWLQCLRKSIKCQLIFTTNKNHLEYTANFQPLEYLGSFLDLADTIRLYNSTYNECIKLNDKNSIQFSFIFGGISAPTIALKDFSDKFNIGKIFFELSNIPGKMFIDRLGTNAYSSLYKHPNQLDDFPAVEESEYLKWKNKYTDFKKCENAPGQAVKINKIYWWYFIDIIAFYLLRIPKDQNINLLKRIFNKLSFKFQSDVNASDLSNVNYLFLPFQVSTDSQILIHSNITNEMALRKAQKIARVKNLKLIVKFHPAEQNTREIKTIKKMGKNSNFYIVSSNTHALVEHATEVITINSSVGLEALILNKKVQFLGKTFYRNFNHDRLKKYIMKYLINVEYFSQKKISEEIVSEIFERIITR